MTDLVDPASNERRELVQVLRKLTPRQRRFLRELPKYGGLLWRAQERMGISSATVSAWLKKPHFRRARELLDELDAAMLPISRQAILRDIIEIKDRCMQRVEPLTDKQGNPVFTETPDGNLARAYVYDAKNALRASELLGKHLRMWGEDKPKDTGPQGPGLTVIVQQSVQGGASSGEVKQQAGVVVNLPGPER